jgi:hypothetical protein
LSFSFPEESVLTEVANELEACLNQLACFFFGVRYSGGEIVVFEGYQDSKTNMESGSLANQFYNLPFFLLVET